MVEESVKYKIGDLVVPAELGCDLYTDEFAKTGIMRNMFADLTGISLMRGEIGTVLEVRNVITNLGSENIIKILAPGGVGWVFEHWVKEVNESR